MWMHVEYPVASPDSAGMLSTHHHTASTSLQHHSNKSYYTVCPKSAHTWWRNWITSLPLKIHVLFEMKSVKTHQIFSHVSRSQYITAFWCGRRPTNILPFSRHVLRSLELQTPLHQKSCGTDQKGHWLWSNTRFWCVPIEKSQGGSYRGPPYPIHIPVNCSLRN